MSADDKLNVFDDLEARRAKAAAILVMCDSIEDKLLLIAAYRRRIREVPEDIIKAAMKRFASLAETTGERFYGLNEALWVMLDVCDALWKRLDEKQAREWLLKVK